jgi:uncharacterized protein with von Willebrand factor type A (vWA) domain
MPITDLVYQSNKWNNYLYESAEVAVPASPYSTFPDFGREIFQRLYQEEPAKLESVSPENAWAETCHGEAADLPEFKAMREQCRGNKFFSALATQNILEAIEPLLPETQTNTADVLRAMGDEAGASTLESSTLDASQVRRALRKAAKQTSETVQEANGYAYGFGDGNPGSENHSEEIKSIYSKVKSNPKLQSIAKLAGRMCSEAVAKQAAKTEYARDEISDITLSDDLARLLPSEVFSLKYQRLLFLKNFAEKSLMTYELTGRETSVSGPVVVCIDHSSSMKGDREIWAKAVALALWEVAKIQKRKFVILNFNTMVISRFESGESDIDIFACLSTRASGGTDFAAPLQLALLTVEETLPKADVIFITDGEADTGFAAEYQAKAKQLGVTTYGIAIESGEETLKTFCDHTTSVDMVSNAAATDMVLNI